MPNGNAEGDPTPLPGKVGFTMMYAAHDAFTRDLQRLTAAVEAGQTADPAVRIGWAMFKKQLHIHHTAEDTSLWPALRAKITRPDHVAVLDATQAEVLGLLLPPVRLLYCLRWAPKCRRRPQWDSHASG